MPGYQHSSRPGAGHGKKTTDELAPFGCYFIPHCWHAGSLCFFLCTRGSGGAGGGQVAKDALGNDVIASAWLKNHGPGDRTLTQGLKGDPTYLVVENDRTPATYGINAVCTHLGCVVPWNAAENKLICPCHGSQYNNQGMVVRGPAPLMLMMEKLCLFHGLKLISEQEMLHGGLEVFILKILLCFLHFHLIQEYRKLQSKKNGIHVQIDHVIIFLPLIVMPCSRK
ncbi:unnamed protein product [Fraxinus pennsylvanica]|uniref:Rieske domain-containing protein n=1 Tax=Fraxinus pennsylvanica TaxID=56036 RepID=A0AAD1ZQ07_9LAMI|nr:unnamed protein product [Fraxinus pennsylvanica]